MRRWSSFREVFMAVNLIYRKDSGFLYRFDPRLKLLLLITLSVSVFSFTVIETGIYCGLFSYFLIFHGGNIKGGILLTFSAFRFIAFISVIYLISGISRAENSGLNQTLSTASPFLLRLLMLILAGFIFTRTTSVTEIRGAAYSFFSKIPVLPAALVSLMFSVTISTIPLFFTSLEKSREAMLCRGSIPWYRPLRRIKSIAFPLLTRVIRRSDILTDSIVSRGFTLERQFILERPKRKETVLTGLIILLLFLRGFIFF